MKAISQSWLSLMVQIPPVVAQASSLPSWLSYVGPVVGVLGFAFGYERWIVDNRVRAEQAKLEGSLESEIRKREHWEQQAKDAFKDVEAAYQALEETLSEISQNNINSDDVIRLTRILGKLKRWGSREKELNDYKRAAQQLKSTSPSLLLKATQRTIKDLGSQTPEFQEPLPWKRRENIRKFKDDVSQYIAWIYDCLFISGHPDNNPLSRFVPKPYISSVTPYISTLNYMKDQGDWSSLSIEQATYLKAMFDELIRRLPTEFRG